MSRYRGFPSVFPSGGREAASVTTAIALATVMEKRGDLWFVTVYQGQQPSGGYGIRVERAIHVGTGVRLRARLTAPTAVGGERRPKAGRVIRP